MRRPDLLHAISEARRFLKRAELMRDAAARDTCGDGNTYQGGPIPASVRRASLDLTKALAALRRGS